MFKFDKHKTDTMSVENLSLPAFPTFDLLKKTRWKRDGPNTWDVLILCARLLVLPMMAKKISVLLTYIGDEMYEIYKNIITVKETTLAQVNAAFKTHFPPTSNPAYKCYLFR